MRLRTASSNVGQKTPVSQATQSDMEFNFLHTDGWQKLLFFQVLYVFYFKLEWSVPETTYILHLNQPYGMPIKPLNFTSLCYDA